MIENIYYSFMLRLWTANHQDGEIIWRTSLQWSETGEKVVFSNLEELVDYIQKLTKTASVTTRPPKAES